MFNCVVARCFIFCFTIRHCKCNIGISSWNIIRLSNWMWLIRGLMLQYNLVTLEFPTIFFFFSTCESYSFQKKGVNLRVVFYSLGGGGGGGIVQWMDHPLMNRNFCIFTAVFSMIIISHCLWHIIATSNVFCCQIVCHWSVVYVYNSVALEFSVIQSVFFLLLSSFSIIVFCNSVHGMGLAVKNLCILLSNCMSLIGGLYNITFVVMLEFPNHLWALLML